MVTFSGTFATSVTVRNPMIGDSTQMFVGSKIVKSRGNHNNVVASTINFKRFTLTFVGLTAAESSGLVTFLNASKGKTVVYGSINTVLVSPVSRVEVGRENFNVSFELETV
jgi:predicted transcriptional regulator